MSVPEPKLKLLNDDHDLFAVIDDFLELRWTRSLWNAGSATLALPRQHRYARQIDRGWLMLPPDESHDAYVIRQRSIEFEGATQGRVQLTAPGLGNVFDNPGRIVIPPSGSHDEQNDVPAESAIKHYVNNHAGPGASSNRQLPGLVIASDQARGDDVTFHARFESIKEVISDIGKAGGLGWQIIYNHDNDEFVFDVIDGVDRTETVFFDLEFESILNLSWVQSDVGRSTFAYVGGEGEGETRQIESVWLAETEPSGFARRETFVDEGTVDEADALTDAGKARLEDSRNDDTVQVSLNPYGSFRYPDDFNVGDLVTVRSREFDLVTEARIVEVEAVIQPPSLQPEYTISIGNPWPDVELRIEEDLKKQKRKHR